MIAAFWSGLAVAQSLCDGDAIDEAERAMDAMHDAFSRVDEAGFDRASKRLGTAVSCLDDPPSSRLVLRIHQAQALAGFVNGQTRASRRSLAAARLLDPAWKLDDALFPPTHPYRDLFADANNPGPVAPLGSIAPKEWLVDGLAVEDAPTDRAFVLQVRDGSGRIEWAGYLWDWEELPDFGQAYTRSALEAPYKVSVSAWLHGGPLSSSQESTSPSLPVVNASSFSAGGDLVARATPLTVVGGELLGSLVAPGDPLLGDGGLLAGHGALLLGGGAWVGPVQPHAAARVGIAVDRVRTWVQALDDPSAAELATVGSLLAGLELGLRGDKFRVAAAFDGKLQNGTIPYGWRARLDGGALVSGPLALELVLDARRHAVPIADAGAGDVEIGRRSDFTLQAGAGLGLWF